MIQNSNLSSFLRSPDHIILYISFLPFGYQPTKIRFSYISHNTTHNDTLCLCLLTFFLFSLSLSLSLSFFVVWLHITHIRTILPIISQRYSQKKKSKEEVGIHKVGQEGYVYSFQYKSHYHIRTLYWKFGFFIFLT